MAVVPLISVPNSNELLVSVLLSTNIWLCAPPSCNINLPGSPAAPVNLRIVSICAPVEVVWYFIVPLWYSSTAPSGFVTNA